MMAMTRRDRNGRSGRTERIGTMTDTDKLKAEMAAMSVAYLALVERHTAIVSAADVLAELVGHYVLETEDELAAYRAAKGEPE